MAPSGAFCAWLDAERRPAAYGTRLGVGEGPFELTARVLLVPLVYQAD